MSKIPHIRKTTQYIASTITGDSQTNNTESYTNTAPTTHESERVCEQRQQFGNLTKNYNVYLQNVFKSENPRALIWQNKVWSGDFKNKLVDSEESELVRRYGWYGSWEESEGLDGESDSTYTETFEQLSISQIFTPVTPCFSVTIPELGNQTFTSYYHQYCYDEEYLLDSFDGAVGSCVMESAIFELRAKLTCNTDVPFPSSREYWKLIAGDYDKDQTIKHSVLGVSLIALLVATIILLSFDRLRNVKTKIHVQLFIAFIIRAVVVFLNDLIEILMLNLYMKSVVQVNKLNNCRATFSPKAMINLKKQAIILAESFVDPGFSSDLNSTKYDHLNSNQIKFLSSAYDENVSTEFLEFANNKIETACSWNINCNYRVVFLKCHSLGNQSRIKYVIFGTKRLCEVFF